MTPILDHKPLKRWSFPIKTEVKWVLGRTSILPLLGVFEVPRAAGASAGARWRPVGALPRAPPRASTAPRTGSRIRRVAGLFKRGEVVQVLATRGGGLQTR